MVKDEYEGEDEDKLLDIPVLERFQIACLFL